MKPSTINRALTIICIAMACWMSSCAKSQLDIPQEQQSSGRLVEVELDMEVVPFSTPEPLTKSGVVARHDLGNMIVELIQEPQDPLSRALDMDEISNFWVFQFDDQTKGGKRVHKRFYPDKYTPGKRFELIEGNNQTIVIVANYEKSPFGEDLDPVSYDDLVLSHRMLTNNFESIFTINNACLPLFAVSKTTVTKDGIIKPQLLHNASHVKLRVRTSTEKVTNDNAKWTVKLLNVPMISSWAPPLDPDPSLVFPGVAPDRRLEHPLQTITTMNDETFTELEWFLPINRSGVAPLATMLTRASMAPETATAIQITGHGYARNTTYTIPLGHNFATDYNLRENYVYTYQITLCEDIEGNDSQVIADDDILYAGMFGGELVYSDVDGYQWYFSKKLYIASVDMYQCEWVSSGYHYDDHSALAGASAPTDASVDGKGNTWRLCNHAALQSDPDYQFSAANSCMRLNHNYEEIINAPDLETALKNPNFQWYLPALKQLSVVSATLGDVLELAAKRNTGNLWCSTELIYTIEGYPNNENSSRFTMPWNIIDYWNKAMFAYNRCTKEI